MTWREPAMKVEIGIVDSYSEDPNLTEEEADQKRQEGLNRAGIIVWGVIIFVFLWALFWGSMEAPPACLNLAEELGLCEP